MRNFLSNEFFLSIRKSPRKLTLLAALCILSDLILPSVHNVHSQFFHTTSYSFTAHRICGKKYYLAVIAFCCSAYARYNRDFARYLNLSDGASFLTYAYCLLSFVTQVYGSHSVEYHTYDDSLFGTFLALGASSNDDVSASFGIVFVIAAPVLLYLARKPYRDHT
ncbi:hypothetical protein [Acetobacter sp. P1H12_c]|uniref:hypothetical protein n=1 Tax=Acetobacter sp. P1H12_c TaxID=2762621 RepID=UPI001C0565F6|nr:hypothetical protein [Acetobacter sp. P1H12_c]